MDTIKIVNFDGKKHLKDVLDLSENNIPQDTDGMETIGRSFKWISAVQYSFLARWTLHLFSPFLEGINTKRILRYVVAVDNNQKVVGVSGVYSVTSRYIQKLGIGACEKEKLARLQDRKNLWIGWTAVSPELRGQGVGARLIREILARAFEVLKHENLDDSYLLVVSDKNAINFYEKLNMIQEINKNNTVIYGIPIREIRKRLGISECC